MTSSILHRSRFLVLVGSILFLLTVGTVVFRLAGKGALFQNVVKVAVTTPNGGANDEPEEARRGRALASIREGRLDQAFAFFTSLDQGRWTAEDCFTIGSTLVKQGRTALGWAALEAARRIDPKYAATITAIDELESGLRKARDPERIRLVVASDRVEILREIPSGPPLGLVVLGLARFAPEADQQEEFLDWVMIRDPARLRSVKTTAAAIYQLGRLLLETGRAVEARDLLAREVDPSGKAPRTGSSGLTPEGAWLLSRAALQLDQKDLADTMLVQAGDFAKNANAFPEPSPFVGSKRCGDCHSVIYRNQQYESHHAETLRLGRDLKDVPLPAQPVADPRIPGITHSFSRKADDRIELTVREQDQVKRAIIEYAVGSGHQGITMIAKDEQGTDRSLRISYLSDGPTWSETKGANASPGEEGEKIGRALGPKSLRHCLHCHATWFRAVDVSQSGPRGPEAQDRGIGCERCHGPGLNHVKAIESGFADGAIAITTKTPAGPRLTSCTECHAADGSVDPSDPEFTRAQGTTLLFSRCYTAAKDRFVCTTCHDPHTLLDNSIPTYESKCLGCHSASLAATKKNSSTAMLTQADHGGAPSCPVNPTSGCIACHMPKVPDPSRRARFTDHHIRIHRERGAVKTSSTRP